MQINVKHNLGDIALLLDDIRRRQLPFATAKALTMTAKAGQRDVAAEMQKKFDRPTPTTLKSLWVKPATKQNLEAMVYVKDKALGKFAGLSTAALLRHQFEGGQRLVKQMEYVLRAQKYLGPDEYVVPGNAAKLDRYGNIGRGQIVQILSQIGVKRPGFDSSPTKSARSQRNVARAGQIFWSYGVGSFPAKAFTGNPNKIDWETGKYKGKGQHLPKGAWVRDGRKVHPLLIAIKTPHYRRRIDMAAIIKRTIDREFDAQFDKAMAEAVRSAR